MTLWCKPERDRRLGLNRTVASELSRTLWNRVFPAATQRLRLSNVPNQQEFNLPFSDSTSTSGITAETQTANSYILSKDLNGLSRCEVICNNTN